MIRRGFTVVELIITITIMGILLLLTVVNVNASQISARDNERVGDVEAFAANLESYYLFARGDGSETVKRYPSDGLFDTDGVAHLKRDLPDLDLKSVMAPGISDPLLTLKFATNNVQTETGVLPVITKDQYLYQPLQADGTLCTEGNQECRKFNIFYRLESDNAIHKITSKNQ